MDRGRMMAWFAVGNVALSVVVLLLASQVFEGNRVFGYFAFSVMMVSVFPIAFLMCGMPWADILLYFVAVVLNGCLWGFIASLIIEARAEYQWLNRPKKWKHQTVDEIEEP